MPARGLRVRAAARRGVALRGVEDHVRGAEALRPGTRAVAGPQAAAAAAEREESTLAPRFSTAPSPQLQVAICAPDKG